MWEAKNNPTLWAVEAGPELSHSLGPIALKYLTAWNAKGWQAASRQGLPAADNTREQSNYLCANHDAKSNHMPI